MTTKIYLVTALDGDASLMSNEQFMDEAEKQGSVWGSWKAFVYDFNSGYSITSETDEIREISTI